MRGIEVYAINVMLRFFPSKILTFIQFMVLLMMISHGLCLAAPHGPTRYITTGPFREPTVEAGDFFYQFTDHYETVGYLSPDMPTFLSFGQWSGLRKNKEKIFLVLDVPVEISIHGGRFVKTITEEPRPHLANGQPHKRYRIDFTYGKTVSRSGMTQLICTTSKRVGQETIIHYATEIDEIVNHKRSLPIKIVGIPKPGPPKKLFTFFDTFGTAIELYPEFKRFREIGFNVVSGFSDFPESTSERIAKKSARADVEAMTWNTEHAENGIQSGNWRARTSDGKETNAISPGYRGAALQKWIKRGENLVDAGIFIHAADPERTDGEKICYSDVFLRDFEMYFKQRNPHLPYISPASFNRKQAEYREYMQAWTDFKSEKYAGLYQYYRENVESHIKKKGLGQKLKMVLYAQPGYKNLKISTTSKSAAIAAIRTSMQDPLKLSQVFDVFAPMIYIDINERFNHRLDMIEVASEIINMRRYLGGHDMTIAPVLSPGFPYTVFKSDIPPGNVMKYQVLEAFASGAKGVGIYSEGFFDAHDMKGYAEAIKQILPVEDIIAEGILIPTAELADLNQATFVKGVKDLHGNAVILVSEYSDASKTARIVYKGAKSALKVVDLNDDVGSMPIISADGAKNSFEVTLTTDRARLFLIKADHCCPTLLNRTPDSTMMQLPTVLPIPQSP